MSRVDEETRRLMGSIYSHRYYRKHREERNQKTRERMARLRAEEGNLPPDVLAIRLEARREAARRYREKNRRQIALKARERRAHAAQTRAQLRGGRAGGRPQGSGMGIRRGCIQQGNNGAANNLYKTRVSRGRGLQRRERTVGQGQGLVITLCVRGASGRRHGGVKQPSSAMAGAKFPPHRDNSPHQDNNEIPHLVPLDENEDRIGELNSIVVYLQKGEKYAGGDLAFLAALTRPVLAIDSTYDIACTGCFVDTAAYLEAKQEVATQRADLPYVTCMCQKSNGIDRQQCPYEAHTIKPVSGGHWLLRAKL
ncbi:hypothetical protein C8R47DRAFT_1074642 [Mycena vitilis]|nr:hypothetical protein C8R47DRAFT_1074642 [Mycena vitilis]